MVFTSWLFKRSLSGSGNGRLVLGRSSSSSSNGHLVLGRSSSSSGNGRLVLATALSYLPVSVSDSIGGGVGPIKGSN